MTEMFALAAMSTAWFAFAFFSAKSWAASAAYATK